MSGSVHAPASAKSQDWGQTPWTPDSKFDHLAHQMTRLEMEITAFREAQGPIIQDAIAKGIEAGFKHLAANPELMDEGLSKLFEALGRRSTKAAGAFTLSMLSGIPKTIFKFVVMGAIVYQFGGWELLISVLRSMNPWKH